MLSISYLISRDFPPDRCAGLAGNYQAKVLFKRFDAGYIIKAEDYGYIIKAEDYDHAILRLPSKEKWFRRWGCPRTSESAASPGPGAATGGAGSGARAATPGRPQAPTASDDEDGSELITGVVGGAGEQAGSPIVAVLTSQPGEGVGNA